MILVMLFMVHFVVASIRIRQLERALDSIHDDIRWEMRTRNDRAGKHITKLEHRISELNKLEAVRKGRL